MILVRISEQGTMVQVTRLSTYNFTASHLTPYLNNYIMKHDLVRRDEYSKELICSSAANRSDPMEMALLDIESRPQDGVLGGNGRSTSS
jgi:hypothetical protein